MSFLKKDINLGLMAIVILLVVCFTVIGVYYNQNYTSLSKEYTSRLENLKQVTDQLLLYKNRLNKTAVDLNTQQQDQSELENKYGTLRDDNQRLEDTKTKLEADLSNTRTELLKSTNDLRVAQVEVKNQETQIAQLTTERNLYQSRSSSYKEKLEKACGGDLSVC